jgi:CheY-like chemotaxis protein
MLRILIVDDWQDSLMTLQLLLQSWGHETHSAYDGPMALKMAETIEPDVVILDIGMPGMDGYQVAKDLRQRGPKKPCIIAHSGYCAPGDVRCAFEAGCNYHLAKPADPDELKRLLDACEQ